MRLLKCWVWNVLVVSSHVSGFSSFDIQSFTAGSSFDGLEQSLRRENNDGVLLSPISSSSSTRLFSSFKSQFEGFQRRDRDNSSFYTHMVGVPLEECHDLMIQLESVQKGILYNCPLLLQSCIMPVMTRMPMLYVSAGKMGNVGGISESDLTVELKNIVDSAVQKYIYTNNQNGIDNDITINNEATKAGVNKDGFKPVLMKFSKLELDGEKCECLHTIGDPDCEGTELMTKVLMDIKTKVEERGWSVALPSDNPQGGSNVKDGEELSWRPRVPFMRLQSDFEKKLKPLEKDGEGNEPLFRMPEEGGDGISPILWYKWWDDEFTEDEGTRLRKISVYKRTGVWTSSKDGQTEKDFMYPTVSVDLPVGNKFLTNIEEEDQKYVDERLDEQLGREGAQMEKEMSEEIEKLKQKYETLLASSENKAVYTPPKDPAVKEPIEKKIESIVESSISNMATTNYSTISTDGDSDLNTTSIVEELPVQKAKEIDFDNDEGIQRIRNMLKKSKTRGSLSNPGRVKEPLVELPPYPSDEYFVGVWRLISLPNKEADSDLLGSINNDSMNSGATDNLILRVDNGVAGGPILSGGQKAAGGEWKMFQARWAGESDEFEDVVQTRLRISLVIPPEKKEVLMMEGKVTRVMMPGSNSFSQNLPPVSFLDVASDSNRNIVDQPSSSSPDRLLYVEGEVWVQSIDGIGSRRKLGRFSAIKTDQEQTPENLQFIVPPPISGGSQ